MDIEKLTKSQIVLLTLLVSFVTSIATGIVTISLVDQAPTAITQSVSRIVRETVQSAVPVTISQSAATTNGATQKPDVLRPTLSQLIAGADRSIVRIYGGSPDNPTFLGLGLVIDASGTVLSDYDAVGSQTNISVAYSNASTTLVAIATRDSTHGFVFLAPEASTSALMHPATLAPSAVQVGDMMIAFSGKSDLRIASGLVTGVGGDALGVVDTNVPLDTIIKGSPFINAEGQFVGISTGSSRAIDIPAFMPISNTILSFKSTP